MLTTAAVAVAVATGTLLRLGRLVLLLYLLVRCGRPGQSVACILEGGCELRFFQEAGGVDSVEGQLRLDFGEFH